ncbi:hypothetical protein U2F26_21695 [Micromonospora sp. 4G57]|uniref:Uncharacterized protein n=1 Tax=Micromonospora sicca TaxID=2202420 RepID=A0ABU5JEN0_9ACTN|nr:MULTISPECIES: hypothetical protein [unclassified Micromonospora]MDZ5445314.1 hypothetical protein [Micromonospora sp. 4G57]MDZ5491043.1 hypothetical protein [Micromonospora sp. 4G53]
MNTSPQSGSRRRLLVALPAIALAAASLNLKTAKDNSYATVHVTSATN